MPKSWDEKFRGAKPAHVSMLAHPFAGVPAGGRLCIASPPLLKARLHAIPPEQTQSVTALREALAREHDAAATCQTSTAIFLRIVAERSLERLVAGEAGAPFWRVIAPGTPLARKLFCGPDFIRHRLALEGHGKAQ